MNAKEWFEANGGIKNKRTRELVMMFDSVDLKVTRYYLKIIGRGRIIIQKMPYVKRNYNNHRIVTYSKEAWRKRNG